MSHIIIAGDFAPQCRVLKYIEEEDYSYIFSDIKHVLEAADFSVVNLEAPIVLGEKTPIIKMVQTFMLPQKHWMHCLM